MLNNIISTLGNCHSLNTLQNDQICHRDFSLTLINGILRNIIWHIPSCFENCLLADINLIFCFAYRFFNINLGVSANSAPILSYILISTILILLIRALNMFLKLYFLKTVELQLEKIQIWKKGLFDVFPGISAMIKVNSTLSENNHFIISDINKIGKETYCLQSNHQFKLFLENIQCQYEENIQSLSQILIKFIQSLNWESSNKRLNLLGKSLNHPEQYDIHMQQITEINENFILLHIEKVSDEKLIQQFKEMDEYKTNLLAKVAHDIRNPISSMDYLIKETIELNPHSSLNSNLSFMQTNILYLKFLVNDILDYCQYKNNKIKYNIDKINISKFANNLESLLQIQTNLKQITFKICNSCHDMTLIKTDQNRLTQVLVNLVSNSIKFTKPGGTIILVIKQIDQILLKFTVQDNGSGMTESTRKKITEPYQTFGNSANPNFQGIGLGLYIRPNEKFNIKSQINNGSAFSFKLYRDLENFMAPAYKNSVQIQMEDLMGNSDELSLSQINIQEIYTFSSPQIINFLNKNFVFLVADDDLFNQKILQSILQKIYVNCQILQAFSGQDALELFETNNCLTNQNNAIDLIIMDCEMPILNGFEASKRIKELIKNTNLYRDVKIMGYSGLAQIEKAKAYLMDDILQKPATMETIQKKIENLLSINNIVV